MKETPKKRIPEEIQTKTLALPVPFGLYREFKSAAEKQGLRTGEFLRQIIVDRLDEVASARGEG